MPDAILFFGPPQFLHLPDRTDSEALFRLHSSSPPTEGGVLKSFLIFDSSKLPHSLDSFVTESRRFRLNSKRRSPARSPGVAPPGIAANIDISSKPCSLFPGTSEQISFDDPGFPWFAAAGMCTELFLPHTRTFRTSSAFFCRRGSLCNSHAFRPSHSPLCSSQIQTSGIDPGLRYQCCQTTAYPGLPQTAHRTFILCPPVRSTVCKNV
jgi:hypothetical protein